MRSTVKRRRLPVGVGVNALMSSLPAAIVLNWLVYVKEGVAVVTDWKKRVYNLPSIVFS